jgi:hypothetical protein
MCFNRFEQQRLQDLEELLELQYKKLAAYEEEIATAASSIAIRFEMEQRIQREVLPGIFNHETERTKLLMQGADCILISEEDANNALYQIAGLVRHIENLDPKNHADDLRQILLQIRKKLDDPGKTATAKLEVTVPLIPLLASWKFEVDTEALLLKTWRQLNELFGRRK